MDQTEAISNTSMKVPKDQGLALAIFYSISLTMILFAWLLLPPTISHENEGDAQVKVLKPEDAISQAEEVLTRVEEDLAQLEKAREEKAKKEKAKGPKSGDKK